MNLKEVYQKNEFKVVETLKNIGWAILGIGCILGFILLLSGVIASGISMIVSTVILSVVIWALSQILENTIKTRLIQEYQFIENPVAGDLNNTKDPVDSSEQEKVDPDYHCPKVTIKSTENHSGLSGKHQKQFVLFEDGQEGEIYLKDKVAYFKIKQGLERITYEYDSIENCYNSLHYYLTTKNILKEGLIRSVS